MLIFFVAVFTVSETPHPPPPTATPTSASSPTLSSPYTPKCDVSKLKHFATVHSTKNIRDCYLHKVLSNHGESCSCPCPSNVSYSCARRLVDLLLSLPQSLFIPVCVFCSCLLVSCSLVCVVVSSRGCVCLICSADSMSMLMSSLFSSSFLEFQKTNQVIALVSTLAFVLSATPLLV